LYRAALALATFALSLFRDFAFLSAVAPRNLRGPRRFSGRKTADFAEDADEERNQRITPPYLIRDIREIRGPSALGSGHAGPGSIRGYLPADWLQPEADRLLGASDEFEKPPSR
jgi:hypothetical protein